MIIALKIFLTLWAMGLFGILIKLCSERPVETWWAVFLAWVFLVIVLHLVLIIPFGVFSWIWFGF